ncbi:hypothetical protein IMCC1989_2575 [gamma proteobacterium IMCC1989]|nr:hypothetical protein IMCC1989_2575 [gamma proteobacterium IMCC1989]
MLLSLLASTSAIFAGLLLHALTSSALIIKIKIVFTVYIPILAI